MKIFFSFLVALILSFVTISCTDLSTESANDNVIEKQSTTGYIDEDLAREYGLNPADLMYSRRVECTPNTQSPQLDIAGQIPLGASGYTIIWSMNGPKYTSGTYCSQQVYITPSASWNIGWTSTNGASDSDSENISATPGYSVSVNWFSNYIGTNRIPYGYIDIIIYPWYGDE